MSGTSGGRESTVGESRGRPRHICIVIAINIGIAINISIGICVKIGIVFSICSGIGTSTNSSIIIIAST